MIGNIAMISKRIVLHFPRRLVNQPIVCRLAKDHDLEFNILKAYVTPKEEGLLVLELSGEDENCKHGIRYLKEVGIKVQPLSQDVIRDERRCSHCGACVPLCPAGALVVEPQQVHRLWAMRQVLSVQSDGGAILICGV